MKILFPLLLVSLAFAAIALGSATPRQRNTGEANVGAYTLPEILLTKKGRRNFGEMIADSVRVNIFWHCKNYRTDAGCAALTPWRFS